MLQEDEIVKDYLLLTRAEPDLSCDCPAHVHDKERPLELELVSQSSVNMKKSLPPKKQNFY